MKIREINEQLSKFYEDYTMEDLVNDWVDEHTVKDLDHGTIEDSADELAKSYGYQLYDDNLVLDVKGRPNLSENVETFIQDNNLYNAVDDLIQDFCDILEKQVDGFVTCGRSNGYWGLSNVYDNLEFTDEFKTALAILIKENTEDEQNYENWEWTLYQYLDNASLSKLVQDNPNTIKFNDEYLDTMKSIEQDIDDKEKAMDSIDFWKQYIEE